MNPAEQIKTLVKEGELYRSQGLLNEARHRYKTASDLIRDIPRIKNRQPLILGIQKKIDAIDRDQKRIDSAKTAPVISDQSQDLIKKLFSFSSSGGSDAAALEGAIALAKFGQISRALEEFNALLEREPVRVVAAKNILRCHLAINAANQAIAQYQRWAQQDRFTEAQLNHIAAFLQQLLKRRGLGDLLKPRPSAPAPKAPEIQPVVIEPEPASDEVLDICSIAISFDHGSAGKKRIELDVSFQAGNVISLMLSGPEKEIAQRLDVGARLEHVQFFSPIAIFEGTAVISAKSKVVSGPKEGDYTLDITIESR
jgi:tetratricopeptide (TPR) repeat protein